MAGAEGTTDPELVDQPSAAPSAKWVAGATTGAATVVLLWVAALVGLEMPEYVAGALVLLAAQAAAYLKRNRAVDTPGEHAA